MAATVASFFGGFALFTGDGLLLYYLARRLVFPKLAAHPEDDSAAAPSARSWLGLGFLGLLKVFLLLVGVFVALGPLGLSPLLVMAGAVAGLFFVLCVVVYLERSQGFLLWPLRR